MGLWLLFAFLIAGLVTGYLEIYPPGILKTAAKTVEVGLIVLLASMGARIGIDKEIITQLDKIGFQAFLISTGSIAGSIVFVKLFSNLIENRIKSGTREPRELSEQNPGNRAMTLKIIFSVTGGIILGLFLPAGYFGGLDFISTAALALLFLGIGVEIGSNKKILGQIKKMGWKIALLPVLVALGSIIGSLVAGKITGLALNEAAAVGSGFGWYSLSGVLLSKMHSVELGSTAFLANVFRELTSILILPFVVKYLGRLTGIAPGGATTMDSTLPVIKKVAGVEMVVPAFISGAVLTSLVPVLVPLLLRL